MFKMTVEKQWCLSDRTLLSGKAEYDEIPEIVNLNKENIHVIGISSGVVPPLLSLEIERQTDNFIGKTLIG